MKTPVGKVNPFIVQKGIVYYSKSEGFNGVIKGDEGDSDVSVKSSKKLDKAPRFSTFKSLELLDKFASMSPATMKLFFYIGHISRYNEEIIKLDTKRFMSLMGIKSRRSVISATKDLTDLGIIGKYEKVTYYWLNPHVIFTGNRITAYPDNLVSYNKNK